MDISYSDYQIANQMIEDYKVLITGANVTQAVVEKLNLEISEDVLEKMIRLEAPKNTRFLEISITDTDPARAVLIANAVREVACTEIKRIMDVEAVNLVYEAEMPKKPSGPPVLNITVLCAGVALCVLMLYFSIRHMMDDSIRTEEDVAARLGLNVLAVIPSSDKIKKQHGVPYAPVNRRQK
jgi:capsular polysaccharide biosynthesis protein